MANYSKLLSLINGVDKTVDFSLASNILELGGGGLQLDGATSGHMVMTAAATTTSYSITWPSAQAASSGYILSNDGTGVLSWVTPPVTGANAALSNLSAVAINTSLLPGTDNSINLGSITKSWATANIHFLDDATGVTSVDAYNRLLQDSSASTSVDYQNRSLKDSASAIQLSWSTSGVEFNQLTASTVPYLNASKVLTSSSVTPTELGYVSGVTSSIQTQLNGKLTSTLPSANIFVGNGSNVATAVAASGDLTLANTGAFTIAAGAVTATKLGTVTDGITLDQTGAGSTLEIKSLGVGTGQIANGAVTAGKLGTVTDGVTTDQGGAGSTIEVLSSPAIKRILTAGQTFTANTSYAVRWGLTANGETAGRIYAADPTTSSFDLFYVIGMASSGTTVTAGSTITVTTMGPFTLSSSDSAFGSNTDGAPVFLTASGGFSTTAPTSAGQAVTRIGMVQVRSVTVTSNIIDVHPVPVAVN